MFFFFSSLFSLLFSVFRCFSLFFIIFYFLSLVFFIFHQDSLRLIETDFRSDLRRAPRNNRKILLPRERAESEGGSYCPRWESKLSEPLHCEVATALGGNYCYVREPLLWEGATALGGSHCPGREPLPWDVLLRQKLTVSQLWPLHPPEKKPP